MTLAAAEFDGEPQKVEGQKIVTGYQPVSADASRKFTWKMWMALCRAIRSCSKSAPWATNRRRSSRAAKPWSRSCSTPKLLLLTVTASDDFGVKGVGLEWTGSLTQDDGKTPIRGRKVSAAGDHEKKDLQVHATFCATREGVAPQTLEIRAWADDYLPGREHSRSAAFILYMLNKTDHALWLTEQFGKWLEVAKESYEREQQLHQTNKELRALSAAELDRPENRRRVSQQAAAENANASRLDSLTQAGRKLVEQATKNDEFDAKRLESWATMLKSLKDIAANRMPSVADLLKQTASAAGGKPTEANTNPGQQSPPPNPAAQTAQEFKERAERDAGSAVAEQSASGARD